MTNTPITLKLSENKKQIEKQLKNCTDIKMKTMQIGADHKIDCYLIYIEVTLSSVMFRTTAMGNFLHELSQLPEENIYSAINENALGLSDLTLYRTIEEAVRGVLIGDCVIFLDGYDKALKIPDKGYPKEGVKDVESEKVIRGSNEGFNDSVKVNTALMRKRLRTPDLKVEQMEIGVRSRSLLNIVYVDGLAKESLIAQVKQRLEGFEIDGILDSGMIEQLTEKTWYSPFPQIQTTQRPDRAVMAVLEGRVVVMVDNSPTALIMPVDYNLFIRTSDDYYNRFQIASFGRMIRYMAAFLAMALPGLYLAVTNFHTQILPTSLLLSFAAARQGVPFPAVVEVLIMELSFELLREAGIRLPGAMGNTIGIVGGLIIGQAAVDANIVSPIVVIVVAFTALCSFAIPSEEFAATFRLLKFLVIGFCAWLGFFGFLLSLMAILIHLAGLKSYGMPYLMPYVAGDLTGHEQEKDALVRFPLFQLRKRPYYTRKNQRIRFRRK